MTKFVILPFIALALAWAFGRNPSARAGFLTLAACWGVAAVLAALITWLALGQEEFGVMNIITLLLLRIPYLLIFFGILLAVVSAIVAGSNAPEAEQRREAVLQATNTAAGAVGKVAGGLAGSFFRQVTKEFSKEFKKNR